ncbi:MAG: damage-inducible protein [Lentisphaerae bacterium RIFOXYC12_FULL_60_16]|nr:MAG: damage-inducible protein [Lentisphaerae bacterium RIFOXYC12_FULL_60_16]OGV70476.1 MAG: damage-inducible protein [Lentisphaerae bacterium RIFOXYA12_FULL_60_10]OGV85893.1 MAG: damage-inducible protein [Lentisphaerae bacterium RIFOXYB12_FULL_60_10]
MYTPVYTKQFEKDLKLCKRRGKNIEKFKILACTLIAGQTPDPIHRDHKLVGNYQGRRDCHIESDWLLIYKIDSKLIIFERMGTHLDLFKK